MGVAVKLSDTPGAVRRAAPTLGEHNEEVFGRLLGIPPDEVAKLRAEKVI